MKENSKVRKIAFVGDHLPRKCGIATFTTDLLASIAGAYPQSQCFCVSVNDTKDGYEYPDVVRFEIVPVIPSREAAARTDPTSHGSG